MATRAENEGFRMLDEFVTDAILEPGVPRADPQKPGKNEGIQVIEELVFQGSSPAEQPGEPTQQITQAHPHRVLKRIGPVVLKAACISVASDLGAQFGGWVGASLGAVLSSLWFLRDDAASS